ncbi:MAG TPA: hypothetical protein VLX09_06305 [Stellaceae bacterium]|nr:hypothetical protein [Stellaceae bacterium]
MASRSYEIQRFSGGRWVLDSVSDDKDVAVAMARALMESVRAPAGVRVMSCQQNDDGTFSEFTVFRASPVDEHNAEAQSRRLKVEEEVRNAREERAKDRKNDLAGEPSSKRRRFQDVILAVQLAFGIGITLTAIQMLRIALR